MFAHSVHLHDAWQILLKRILNHGDKVAPRGKETVEILNAQLKWSSGRQNVIVNPVRDLNYRFMVAEWLWISLGRVDVHSLARYNGVMRNFSDDGIRLAGSYGPPVRDQLRYVIKSLQSDATSRQAVLTIWRPNPGPSKDIPCTLSLQFLLRRDQLHVTANMRSSDAWLGVPYDAFNFSQIGNALAGALGVELGTVTMNLASSHLYQPHYEAALHAASSSDGESVTSPHLESWPLVGLNRFLDGDGTEDEGLAMIKESRQYAAYALALASKGKAEALTILKEAAIRG